MPVTTISEREFIEKFRGRLMLFLVDAWAARNESPSSQGLLLDRHTIQVKKLLSEIYAEYICHQTAIDSGELVAKNGNGHRPGNGQVK